MEQAATKTGELAARGSAERIATILLPLDGSELSEAAVPYAVELARLMRARLVLLRVLEETAPVFDTVCRDMIVIDERNARVELQSPAMLTPVITRLSDAGLQPRAVVRLGDPSEEILAEADHQPQPTIVMTSHGRGGLGRVVTGSVATRVLRHASCPVLIVRPASPLAAPAPVHLRRLVVPLDGSPLSERALPLAEAIAQAAGAALKLVRVAETTRDEMPDDIASRHILPADRATLRRFTRKEDRVRTYLRAVSGRLRRAGIEVSWEALSGDPAHQLQEMLAREKPDLVVMTTHGHGAVARWWFGSVADELLTSTHTPILLIRVREPLGDEFKRALA